MIRMASILVLTTLLSAEWKDLTALRAWRAPAGTWVEASEVSANPEDSKRLAWKPGKGALVNGPTGRTTNLLTSEEFGDIDAHIEFTVAQGSNSGVYFMGRYEIQVLDSFGNEKITKSDCGSIYQRWDPARGKGNEGFEGHAPRVNASTASRNMAELRCRVSGATIRRFGEEDGERTIREGGPQRPRDPRECRRNRSHAGEHLGGREAFGTDHAPGRPRAGCVPQHPDPSRFANPAKRACSSMRRFFPDEAGRRP